MLATRMREISEGICHAHGAQCSFEYTHEFAPTVNSGDYVELAVSAARNIVGAENVEANVQPMMISEDFGAFLQVVPGNFAFIGNGDTGKTGGVPLHNSTYDFNDDILLTGARYFAEIARLALPLA
jgi:hippurate hydrolase